jgi:FkbM family methyltransferase
MIMEILGSDNKIINLEISDQDIIDHIKNPTSYIDVIVNQQINRDKIYDFFFSDKKNLTIVDAGANVGMFSIHCSPSAKIIYAIEPTPSHFNILTRLVSKFNNIKPLNCALWKNDEDITFWQTPGNSTSNSVVANWGIPITVQGKRLKTIIKENNIKHIDLLKIDIEGSEFEIINDDFIEFCEPIVDNWFLEVHPYSHYCSNFTECQQRIVDMFKKFNYKVENKGSDGMFIYR